MAPGFNTQATGTLTFTPGQRSKTISVALVADTEPQPDRVFLVVLEPSLNMGGAVLPPATATAAITILANDQAGGVFDLLPALPIPAVPEATPERNASYVLARDLGGAFALVDAHWAVDAACRADVAEPDGIVTFLPGERRHTFYVVVRDDPEPELARTCTVSLTQLVTRSVGQGVGELAPMPTAVQLVIPENDDARGRFALTNAPALQRMTEGSDYTLALARQAGAFGSVRLSWELVAADPGWSSLPEPEFWSLLAPNATTALVGAASLLAPQVSLFARVQFDADATGFIVRQWATDNSLLAALELRAADQLLVFEYRTAANQLAQALFVLPSAPAQPLVSRTPPNSRSGPTAPGWPPNRFNPWPLPRSRLPPPTWPSSGAAPCTKFASTRAMPWLRASPRSY